jgi:hypothetical protein
MKFITKLDTKFNVEALRDDLKNILKVYPWPKEDIELKMPGNQLSIKHRINENIWTDGTGNLYDPIQKKFICSESDFTEFNPHLGDYTREVLKSLEENEGTTFGRIRYMKLEPKKGLSVHRDFNIRYHIVLYTNTNAFFGEIINNDSVSAHCHHLPADGYVYKVDTLKDHFVYNGGWEDRIHIVINSAC